jgi:hypothetical protein
MGVTSTEEGNSTHNFTFTPTLELPNPAPSALHLTPCDGMGSTAIRIKCVSTATSWCVGSLGAGLGCTLNGVPMPTDLVVISRKNYTLKLQDFSDSTSLTISDADGEIVSGHSTFTYSPRFNESGALASYTCGTASGHICIGSDNSFCVALGAENRYVINGVPDAVLSMVADERYTFQMMGVSASHPFLVSNSNLGGILATAWPTTWGINPSHAYNSFVVRPYAPLSQQHAALGDSITQHTM